MSKSVPQIQKYMTTTPHSVGADQNLNQALELMRKYGIRHLPVLKGGTLTGIISDRDLKLALGIRGVDANITKVDEVLSEEVYITEPTRLITEVVAEMAEKRIGSAVVVQNHKLVGIFTTTDALKVLAEIFETRLK